MPARPDRCPECGSADVRRILYGLVAPPPLDPGEGRPIVAAVCEITPRSPRWACADCRHRWAEGIGQYTYDPEAGDVWAP